MNTLPLTVIGITTAITRMARAVRRARRHNTTRPTAPGFGRRPRLTYRTERDPRVEAMSAWGRRFAIAKAKNLRNITHQTIFLPRHGENFWFGSRGEKKGHAVERGQGSVGIVLQCT